MGDGSQLEKKTALVLSGGGARGAYQVGVLKALAEITATGSKNPFPILTGVSAGAINASFMAAGTDQFTHTVEQLAKLWSELTSEKVFRTDAVSLGKIGLSLVGELSLGGLKGATPGKSLVDTSPLKDLIKENVAFHKIGENISAGHLHAISLTAMDYKNSSAVSFIQGRPEHRSWSRTKRYSLQTQISSEHVLASSAIPVLFSPVAIGQSYFGDGCVRNHAPLSPAIHMGAEKLFVIGVRKQDSEQDAQKAGLNSAPSLAKVANVLLNAVLLDGVELDIERLERVNQFVASLSETARINSPFTEKKVFFVSPSEDIGALAAQMASRLPRVVRYLLKGLGPLEDAAEIISYLLFEKDFCQALIAMGYRDAMKQKDQIEHFFSR